jgi:hypothetical protein
MFSTVCAMALVVVWLGGCSDGIVDAPLKYDDERDRHRDRTVRQNMRATQLAAEHFAADHGGNLYPSEVNEEFRTYFPGGVDGRREAPVGPINAFTGTNEFPTMSTAIKKVEETRHGKRFEIPAGAIWYCALDGGQSYAIVGGAHDNRVLMDENNPSEVLVFSNR